MATDLIAAGLVIDTTANGTFFPSAGGNSANPRVQAIYWRCVTMLMLSARVTNPDARLALFSNADPPCFGGISLRQVLKEIGVEIHLVEARARLAPGTVKSFGNVLYFMDIFDSLQSEPDDTAVLLLDCDVLLTKHIGPVFNALRSQDFAGYRLETGDDEDVNGLTLSDMSRVATMIFGEQVNLPCQHFGGEIFGASLGSWRRHRSLFERMLDHSLSQAEGGHGLLTEEHMFSVAFAQRGCSVFEAGAFIKRIWTSPLYNTAQRSDSDLAMWHLPAEKRYGLHDLYYAMANRGFPIDISSEEFLTIAASCCGIPKKSPTKIVRDGARQIASKLGLRT